MTPPSSVGKDTCSCAATNGASRRVASSALRTSIQELYSRRKKKSLPFHEQTRKGRPRKILWMRHSAAYKGTGLKARHDYLLTEYEPSDAGR